MAFYSRAGGEIPAGSLALPGPARAPFDRMHDDRRGHNAPIPSNQTLSRITLSTILHALGTPPPILPIHTKPSPESPSPPSYLPSGTPLFTPRDPLQVESHSTVALVQRDGPDEEG